MNLKKFIAFLGVLTIIVAFSGCSLVPGQKATGEKKTITVWQLFDDKDVFDQIIKNFVQSKNNEVNVDVVYIKKDYIDYVTDTVNALAAGKGPDIWMIRNDWMPRQYDKLIPAPDSVVTTDQYKNKFPQVAVNDNIINGKVYGLPWSIDTLVLYYNTDIFQSTRNDLAQNNKINSNTDTVLNNPPLDWEELIKDTKLLTIKEGNTIKRAGISLGLSNNIDKSEDILSALMLQNNAKMVADDKKSATFNLSITKQSGELYYPGTKALEFYNSFANSGKENYSWDANMPNSVDAFIQGKSAMMIDYGYVQKNIYNQAPTLKYSIAPLPQIKDTAKAIDYASYWTETVTNNSKNPELAWQFISFVGTNNVDYYSQATKRPKPFKPTDPGLVPAPKDRVNQKTQALLFQLDSAQDWYKGQYAEKVDDIFHQLITSVSGGQPSQTANDTAANNVTTLLRKDPY